MIEHEKDVSQRTELKKRIIVKAEESFRKKGIKSITMDEIAATLGISKRTLYEVFEDKETLLRECVLKVHEDRRAYLEEVYLKADNVLEVILAVFRKSVEILHITNRRFFEDIKKYPKVYAMLQESRHDDSERTVVFFKSGVEQGLFRADVNFEIVNLMVREQFNVLLNTAICNAYPFFEVYEAIMFTYIRGISTEKGSKVLDEFIEEYRKSQLSSVIQQGASGDNKE